MWAIGSELAIVGFLLLLNGALALAEMAVVSARRSRLRTRASSGDAGAAAALALLAEPTRFLSTVQIGITLIGILLGAVSGATLASEIRSRLQAVPGLAGYAQPLSLAVVVGVTTYLSLVVGELVPKRIAQNAPEAIASGIARPMRLLATIAAPLVAILTLTTEGVLRVLRVHASGEPALTEEDVRLLIVQGTEAGVIQAGERQVVEAAFELGDREVRELMTPRVLVTWLDLEAGREAAVAKWRTARIATTRFARVSSTTWRACRPRETSCRDCSLAASSTWPRYYDRFCSCQNACLPMALWTSSSGLARAWRSWLTNRVALKACSPRRIFWKSWLVSRLPPYLEGYSNPPLQPAATIEGGQRVRRRQPSARAAQHRRAVPPADRSWSTPGADPSVSIRICVCARSLLARVCLGTWPGQARQAGGLLQRPHTFHPPGQVAATVDLASMPDWIMCPT
jgi:hypothetical protein